MNRFIIPFALFLLFTSAFRCATPSQDQATELKDNPLIQKLYLKDIEIRELDAKTDTVILEAYDQVHRAQVFQLLAENKVLTRKDKIRAAWILQHTAGKICDGAVTSISPENYLLAYQLSSTVLAQLVMENDTATIRKENIARIVAMNYDRYLLYTLGYQKYGTQFVFTDTTGEMLLAPIDCTLATDEDRKKHQVEPLSVLIRKHKMKPLPTP